MSKTENYVQLEKKRLVHMLSSNAVYEGEKSPPPPQKMNRGDEKVIFSVSDQIKFAFKLFLGKGARKLLLLVMARFSSSICGVSRNDDGASRNDGVESSRVVGENRT